MRTNATINPALARKLLQILDGKWVVLISDPVGELLMVTAGILLWLGASSPDFPFSGAE